MIIHVATEKLSNFEATVRDSLDSSNRRTAPSQSDPAAEVKDQYFRLLNSLDKKQSFQEELMSFSHRRY